MNKENFWSWAIIGKRIFDIIFILLTAWGLSSIIIQIIKYFTT